jgi:hypothetical protein
MFPYSKVILLTAASASLALVGAGAASAQTASTNPYVAGDMHNHNTCTDGTVAAGYAIDRAVAAGTAAGGGKNFNLDWFTLGNHGGSGNRDCRFSDASANIPGDTTTTWSQTLGQTINGITITSLKGTPNGTGSSAQMWRWQSIEEIEYPIVVNRTQMYNKVLVEGLEWVVPGHEHTDVAVLSGQNPMGSGNAANIAQFEFLYDRQDNDAIGPVDGNNNPLWTGKNFNNSGTAGHQKAVDGIHWLQSRFPLTSYAIPTHSERAGAFSTTSSAGYNIEHFRDFNNAGPTVAFGIESPGHMAQGDLNGNSGSYTTSAVGGGTYGFGGVYTAKVGGLWDGLLGEGRNSFIYVSSDWHQRGAFGARDAFTSSDFLPGEFTKLYVPNSQGFNAQAIVNGMRSGNSYSVNADIIGPDMVFRAHGNDGIWKTMGETLVVTPGETITLEMQLTVPNSNNSPYSFNNPLLTQVGINQPLNKPMVDHVDLITGQITGVIAPTDPNYSLPHNVGGVAGAALVYNPTTTIAQQVQASAMTRTTQPDGSTRLQFTRTFTAGSTPMYIRSRGTNIPNATPNVSDAAGNPLLDVNNTKVACTDPACPTHLSVVGGVKRVMADVQAYSNVWFYANPIFVRPAGTPLLLVETNAALAKSLGTRTAGR